MPTLTVMCGTPASGKSTVAASLAGPGVRVIVSDEYRRFITGSYGDSRHDDFVRETCATVARHFLGMGDDVVYDATNPTRMSRSEWVELAASVGSSIRCVFVSTPLKACLERNRLRENVVPDAVVERIAALLEVPTTDEGFVEVVTRDNSSRGCLK